MRLRSLLLVALVGVCLGACRGSSSGTPAQYLSIATGGTGGVYYPYGGGIAKVLNESLPNVRATAEVTAASVDNLKLIRDGRADVAFTLADTLADALAGRGAFEGRPVNAQSIGALYANYTQIVTLAQSNIRRVADVRGKTVSSGSAGSGTEVIAVRLMKAAGLDPDRDVTRQALGVSESADALKDGKIDAFFWSGGLPTAAIQDLSHTPGITIRLIPTDDLLAAMQGAHGPIYFQRSIPTGAYPGVNAPLPVIAVVNVLVVNASMPEPLAYDITKILIEHQPELASIHPEARHLSLDTAAQGSPAPYHPGAVRYYREKGLTHVGG